MGGKQSSPAPRGRTYSSAADAVTNGSGPGLAVAGGGGASTSGGMVGGRGRTRSLGSVQHGSSAGHGLTIPTSNGGTHGALDSDSSTPEESPSGPLSAPLPMVAPGRAFMQASSLPVGPVHLFPFQGIKCPVCNKFIASDDIECHLVMCLTRPRISYNEDVLTEDKGECVICLDDLQQGDTIARLPCLCIYHKPCIDNWFKVNRSCPEHPVD